MYQAFTDWKVKGVTGQGKGVCIPSAPAGRPGEDNGICFPGCEEAIPLP